MLESQESEIRKKAIDKINVLITVGGNTGTTIDNDGMGMSAITPCCCHCWYLLKGLGTLVKLKSTGHWGSYRIGERSADGSSKRLFKTMSRTDLEVKVCC